MTDPLKTRLGWLGFCLVLMGVFTMTAGAELPMDSSRILAVKEKDMLVAAVYEYKERVHDYREDILRLKSDREWLVIRMMRIEDQKRPVPMDLKQAKDRIDVKLMQIDSDMIRITALTEKHLADLRTLDARVRQDHRNQTPDWWQLDAWIYSLMYPEKTASSGGTNDAPAMDSMKPESFGAESPLRNDLEMKIKSVELDNWVALVPKGKGFTLDVQLPILFGQGKSDVARDYKPFFKKLAWLLKPYAVRIDVAGYSDSESSGTAPYATRMSLGATRAANVVQELIDTGMPPDAFRVISAGDYGDTNPEKKDLSAAMKRRVDVRVYFENDQA